MHIRPLVHTQVARHPLPDPIGQLYEYLVAGNGVFIRSAKPGLAVLFPVLPGTLPRLPALTPSLTWEHPRVPRGVLEAILAQARTARDKTGRPVELLCHLSLSHGAWALEMPEQTQSTCHVIPTDPANCPSYHRALIELHSHHDWPAFFSDTDTADEQGFRIYAVLGTIRSTPTLLTRIGVYGHYWTIPASLIFDLPPSIVCGHVTTGEVTDRC